MRNETQGPLEVAASTLGMEFDLTQRDPSAYLVYPQGVIITECAISCQSAWAAFSGPLPVTRSERG